MNEKDYHVIIRCRHCPIPVKEYDFTFEELEDYIKKGKDRPKHWGWVEHKGYIYQGREG
jgi:hypothetical protein